MSTTSCHPLGAMETSPGGSISWGLESRPTEAKSNPPRIRKWSRGLLSSKRPQHIKTEWAACTAVATMGQTASIKQALLDARELCVVFTVFWERVSTEPPNFLPYRSSSLPAMCDVKSKDLFDRSRRRYFREHVGRDIVEKRHPKDSLRKNFRPAIFYSLLTFLVIQKDSLLTL